MTIWLELEGKKRRVDLPAATGTMECSIDGRVIAVDAKMLQSGVLSLIVNGQQYCAIQDGDGVWIGGRRFEFAVNDPRSLAGRRSSGAGAEGPRSVKAPMPGRVVRVLAEAGTEVSEGQGVVVIEAMKMQNELKSPKTGRVARVAVAPGDTVGSGDVLVIVE